MNVLSNLDETNLQGITTICGLALAIVSLPTESEVSISTHYEDIKGDTKCRKWGGLG